ncbi:Cytochrome c-550 [Peribacillus frigoritolerans]|uniref:cytochrome c550 n=1 Tax=Peribacillus frigoritolerans TaxID=450367 RepID=UPI001D89A1D4|nr:cytochrome c [Peribacillus frigoritolerans]CAH0283978.1 Cytochrome c-550 [Peribacillus frigoritolerans]
MKRNPVMPFIIIMVFGLGLMFLLSFKGLGDAKDLAKEKEGGEKTEETENASASPEDIYKQNCISCHGDAYQGGVGPALKGVGDRLSVDEVKNVITNGRGAMPPGLVEEQNIDAMAEYIHGLK